MLTVATERGESEGRGPGGRGRLWRPPHDKLGAARTLQRPDAAPSPPTPAPPHPTFSRLRRPYIEAPRPSTAVVYIHGCDAPLLPSLASRAADAIAAPPPPHLGPPSGAACRLSPAAGWVPQAPAGDKATPARSAQRGAPYPAISSRTRTTRPPAQPTLPHTPPHRTAPHPTALPTHRTSAARVPRRHHPTSLAHHRDDHPPQRPP